MSSWKRLSQLERQVEANILLPQPKKNDNSIFDIRQALVDRIGLGLQKLTPCLIDRLRTNGYDNYLIDSVNSESKLGKSIYIELINLRKVDISNEYIAFHYFRNKIKITSRIKIAQLLSHYFNSEL